MQKSLQNYPKLKVTLHSILYWVVFIAALLLSWFLFYRFIPVHPGMENMRHGMVATVVALAVTWFFLKQEKKSFADAGLVWESKTLLRFLVGLLAGAIIFSLIFFGLLQFTVLKMIKNNYHPDAWVLLSYLAFIPLAFMEEVAFRSYPFIKLNQVFNLRITQLIVGTAFALYHLVNGWSVLVAFEGPFVWSFVFGLAAVWSRGLAVPTGIHVAVNVLQNVFGLHGAGSGSAWQVQFVPGPTAAFTQQAERAGLLMQALLLLAAVISMELFIRYRKKEPLR